jgi:hypothetical protein
MVNKEKFQWDIINQINNLYKAVATWPYCHFGFAWRDRSYLPLLEKNSLSLNHLSKATGSLDLPFTEVPMKPGSASLMEAKLKADAAICCQCWLQKTGWMRSFYSHSCDQCAHWLILLYFVYGNIYFYWLLVYCQLFNLQVFPLEDWQIKNICLW